jgi:hypothetical protein
MFPSNGLRVMQNGYANSCARVMQNPALHNHYMTLRTTICNTKRDIELSVFFE